MPDQIFFAQKAFICREGKILLIKKSNEDPHQANKWEVPGGRIKFGEHLEDHIKREVREEVGLEIDPGDPFHMWQWQNKLCIDGSIINRQIIAVARLCNYKNGEISFLGNECDDYLAGEYAWCTPENILNYEIIENMIPTIKKLIDKLGAISARQ